MEAYQLKQLFILEGEQKTTSLQLFISMGSFTLALPISKSDCQKRNEAGKNFFKSRASRMNFQIQFPPKKSFSSFGITKYIMAVQGWFAHFLIPSLLGFKSLKCVYSPPSVSIPDRLLISRHIEPGSINSS